MRMFINEFVIKSFITGIYGIIQAFHIVQLNVHTERKQMRQVTRAESNLCRNVWMEGEG